MPTFQALRARRGRQRTAHVGVRSGVLCRAAWTLVLLLLAGAHAPPTGHAQDVAEAGVTSLDDVPSDAAAAAATTTQAPRVVTPTDRGAGARTPDVVATTTQEVTPDPVPPRPTRWLLTFGVGLGLAGRLSVDTGDGTNIKEYADGVGQYVFGLDCYGPNGYFAFSLNLVERTAHRSYSDGSAVNTYESGKALTFSLSSGLSVLRFPLWIFPAQLYVGLGLFQMSNDDRLEDSSLLPITGIEGRLNVRAIGPLYVTGALQFGNRLGAPDSGWAFAATLDVGIRVTADSSVDPVAPETLPAGHAVAAGAR